MHKRRTLLSLLTLSVLLSVASAGAQPPPGGHLAYVTGIVDGDTIHVHLDGRMETVRYIGINTPEIHHPTRGKEPYGDAAREVNRRLVEGQWVWLVTDIQSRDRFGRLLAYVWVGNRFVNAELVWRGYAEPATYPPNVRYRDYFVSLGQQARANGHGLWSDKEALAYYRPQPVETPATVAVPKQTTTESVPTPGTGPSGSAAFVGSGGSYSAGGSSSVSGSTGGDVSVRGYTRSDGSSVAPYTRSAPRRR